MRDLIETNKITEITCPYCGYSKSSIGYFVDTETGCVTTEEWDCCSCGKATYIKRYSPPAKMDIPMQGATIYRGDILSKSSMKCPYCGSIRIKRNSFTSRLIGLATFGFLGKGIGAKWHCNKCNSDF